MRTEDLEVDVLFSSISIDLPLRIFSNDEAPLL